MKKRAASFPIFFKSLSSMRACATELNDLKLRVRVMEQKLKQIKKNGTELQICDLKRKLFNVRRAHIYFAMN